MQELLQKAKNQLQAGDIKNISERYNIPYQTLYKAIQYGAKSKKQNEIIKAVTDFLEERKNELKRLESVLN